MKKRIATAFMVVAVAAVFAGLVAVAQQKSFTIVMPGTFAVSGKSKSQMQVFAEEITKALSQVAGAPIELQTTNLAEEDYMKFAISNLVSKKIDVAGFSADWYAGLSPQMREKFPPLMGIMVNGKKNMNYCYYVRKSDNIKSIDQLRGKTFSTYTYIDGRYLLYKAGIDEPLDKFFGKVVYNLGVAPEYMKALVDKKIDTFDTWDFMVETARSVDPKFKDIVPLACNEFGMNSFMIYRKDLDPAVIDKLRKAALNWKKDPRFSNVKMFFVAVKGDVFVPTEKDFQLSYDVDKLSTTRKWNEERRAFLKKNGR